MPDSYHQLILSSGLPRQQARALMEVASGQQREWLIAHGDEHPDPTIRQRFLGLATRCAVGEPLAYVVGWREFFGRRFAINPQVLIPRPETELLVEFAVTHAPAQGDVLELGCGSGAVIVSLGCERRDLNLTATDLMPDALRTAQANADSLDCGPIQFLQGNWFEALPGQERFDLIMSNPPYIARQDPHLAAGDLRYEPAIALVSGADGLDAIRAIATQAPRFLKPGGTLIVEHGHTQSTAVCAIFALAGLKNPQSLQDLAGHWRVSLAVR